MLKKDKKELTVSEKTSKKLKNYQGYVTITSTFNNTIITLTDIHHKVCNIVSAGRFRLKGVKKTIASKDSAKHAGLFLGKKALNLHINKVVVHLKGLGKGKRAAITGLVESGIKINFINKINLLPHNGTRLKKKRRI